MAGNAGESGRSVTSKVTAILLRFTDAPTYSLTELAQLTACPRPRPIGCWPSSPRPGYSTGRRGVTTGSGCP
jgi:hypothetical protein